MGAAASALDASNVPVIQAVRAASGIIILPVRSRLAWLVVCVLTLACELAQAAPAERRAPQTLKVGRLTLHRCETVAAWCGELPRPLDPSGRLRGTLSIYFEYYPHSGAG